MLVSGQWQRQPLKKGIHKYQSYARCDSLEKANAFRSEQAGQTLNVDLCFVPAMHHAEIKRKAFDEKRRIAPRLPTVSGSSGKLVIQHANSEPVFADENLSYPEAMRQFVAASAAEGLQSDGTASEVQLTDREIDTPNSEQAQCRAEKRALRQDEEALRAKRRQNV